MNASTYKLILNQVAVESLNADLVRSFFYISPITKSDFCQHFLINGCYQKGEYQGKIIIDRENKNFLLNKFKITGKFIKMGTEVFDLPLLLITLIFSTLATSRKCLISQWNGLLLMGIMNLLELNVLSNLSNLSGMS